MTATLELTDGVDTIDLLDGVKYKTSYQEGLSIPRPPSTPIISANKLAAIRFQPRTIVMTVDILGASQSVVTTNLRALDRMMRTAQSRQLGGSGSGRTLVTLKYQQGNTDSQDISIRVITGGFSPNREIINEVNIGSGGSFNPSGVLTLICEPFGRLPDVIMGRKTLHNEVDGTGINHVDIGDGWGGFNIHNGTSTVVDCGSDASIDDIWPSGGFFRIRFRLTSLVATCGLMKKGTVWQVQAGSNGEVSFTHTFSGTDFVCASTDANLVVDRWYVLTGDYDNGATGNLMTMKLSTEGAAAVTLTVNTTTPTGTADSDAASNFIIGNDFSSNFCDGEFSEIGLYDNDGNSDSLLQELDGDESDLVLLLNFQEGSGTNVRDNSPNANDGTISGGSWGIDPTLGDAGGLLQVRIEDQGSNPWTASKVLYMGLLSGEVRTNVLFDQVPNSVVDVDNDILAGAETGTKGITGGPTGDTSGGTSAFFRTTADATSALQQNFLIRGYFNFAPTTLPRGFYRVLARCQVKETAINVNVVPSIFGFALGTDFGAEEIVPADAERVQVSAFDQWELLDLGTLQVPPLATPDGFTDPTLQIRVNAVLNLQIGSNMQSPEFIEWSCDLLQLIPIAEGAVIVDDVSATDEILADFITDDPGVWKLNTSSVVQEFADISGGPMVMGPEPSRLHWAKDDPNNPSNIQAFIFIKYTPLVTSF